MALGLSDGLVFGLEAVGLRALRVCWVSACRGHQVCALGVVVGFRAVAVAASMRGPGDYGMWYVFESGCLELSG